MLSDNNRNISNFLPLWAPPDTLINVELLILKFLACGKKLIDSEKEVENTGLRGVDIVTNKP